MSLEASDLLVTIGLPVYNGGELTRRAIEAVLAQTHGALELVISDNCSTDATGDICREYVRRDARIVYTRTDRNLGAARNYNRLVQLARGGFFKWISHDDWIAPEFVAECLAEARRDPEIITVAPVVDIVDEQGNRTQSVTSYTGRTGWSADRLEQYRQMMDELAYCETHGDGLMMIAYEYGLHRTALLRQTRLELPFISADYVLAAELALFGRLVQLDRHLSRFTLSTNPAGTSGNFVAWNPGAIQRMLTGVQPGRWALEVSVRRRHLEHLAAVLRSPLSRGDKTLALEAATRPMRARLAARVHAGRPSRHPSWASAGEQHP